MIKTYKSRNPKRRSRKKARDAKKRKKEKARQIREIQPTLAVRKVELHKFDMIGFSLWFMNSGRPKQRANEANKAGPDESGGDVRTMFWPKTDRS